MRYGERKTQAALELHDQGVSYCEIARRLGVAHQTVRRWVIPGERERHNYVIRRSDRRRRSTNVAWFKFRAQRAAMFLRDGWSWEQLAEYFGVPEHVVKRWVSGPVEKKKVRKPQKNRSATSETGSRQRNTAHEERIAAHRERILRGE